MQKKNKLWQAALTVSASSVLAFSAFVYGQSGSSGQPLTALQLAGFNPTATLEHFMPDLDVAVATHKTIALVVHTQVKKLQRNTQG